jgi:GNAT superfamily N-acetyltransferase
MNATKSTLTFSVRQFALKDLEQVTELFREGRLASFAGSPDDLHAVWNERTEKRLRTDMADIHGTYIVPGGNFWVAAVPDATKAESESIAGIVGLLRTAEGEGKVLSMYVSADRRRLGIGRLLMERVLDWAATCGYHRVFLDTIAANKPSRVFYESIGFVLDPQSPPKVLFDGRLEVVTYAKDL